MFQKPDKRPPEWHWKVTAFVTLALASLVLYQGVFIVSERWVYESRGIFNPHRLLAAFAATPETEFPPAPRGARKGPADAVAQVVAFTSFHCPACRQFNREFGVIMRRFSEDVVLEFRHFPLAAPCNPIMRASGLEQEAGACATSYAAVAAMRQGKFWEFHDTLFSEHFPPEDATPLAVAVEIGLDIEQFNADRKSEDVRAAVQADTELGAQLGIEETPAIFINRRRIPGAGPRALEVIIADIVKQHRN